MVVELFKLEVPEIAEEVIQIRAVARDSEQEQKSLLRLMILELILLVLV